MKARILFALVLMVALAMAASLSAQQGGIVGTDHDLRTDRTTGDVCISCHTPHNANPSAGTALLWVRAVRTTGYQVYNSTVNPDFGGGTPDLTAGNQVSLLCLSCHDGAAALNVTWDAKTQTGYRTSIGTGSANIGTDLRNDHPIGFLYSDSVTAKGLTAYNATPTGSVRLQAGRVECASCHQVHNNSTAPFLRQSNASSALCLACHK
jgi:predicted CXXCH cytochrome family protein